MQAVNRYAERSVSVIIVNYDAGPLLASAAEAVLACSVPVEVFVIDNASTDDSIELLRQRHPSEPRLNVILNSDNLGFSRASNIGLTKARGEFVLLLNPDCIIKPGTIERMLDVLQQHPEAGAAGCLIRNADGTEQAGCRRNVPTPWRTLVRVLHLDRVFSGHPRFRNFVLTRTPLPTAPVPVEAISGAFMLARREAVESVGLLDEAYFLHCDDLDWCMRFYAAGWKILFVPNVEVVHYQGACSADRPIFVLWHKHKGMVRFYRKFFRHQYPLLLMVLVVLAVWTRFSVCAGGVLVKHGLQFARARSATTRNYARATITRYDETTVPITAKIQRRMRRDA